MRKTVLTLIALLFTSLLLVGCGNTEPVETEEKLVPVEVAVAAVADLEKELELTGEVLAGTEVSLTPKMSGRVNGVNVKVGQSVSRGTVLFTIEGSDIQNRLRIEEATLAMQKLNLESSQRTYDRMKLLFNEGAISLVEYEGAETAYKLAQAQFDQAQAAYDITKESFNDLAVTSPINGKVSFIRVEVGELVGPQAPVVGVVNLDTVMVKLNLSEALVSTVSVGQKVDVHVNALGKSYEGVIKSIAPKVDNMTRAFPVEIIIANTEGDILAGMVAKLRLSVGQAKDAVVVPAQAVLENNGQHRVYVVEDDVAHLREVEVGIVGNNQIQIVSGIAANDQVITAGNRMVGDGQRVAIVKTTGEAGGDK